MIEKKLRNYSILLLVITAIIPFTFNLFWGFNKVEVQFTRIVIILISILLLNKGYYFAKIILISFSFICTLTNFSVFWAIDEFISWKIFFLMNALIYMYIGFELIKVEKNKKLNCK